MKNLLKRIIKNYNFNNKTIYYTLTFRPYNSQLPLVDMESYSYKKLTNFLKTNNIYLLFSHHTINNSTSDLNTNENIIEFDYKKYPLIDNNELLIEVDILIVIIAH